MIGPKYVCITFSKSTHYNRAKLNLHTASNKVHLCMHNQALVACVKILKIFLSQNTRILTLTNTVFKYIQNRNVLHTSLKH